MNREDLSLLLTRSHNAVPSVLSVYLSVDQSQPENLSRGFEARLKQLASSTLRKVAAAERTRFKAAMLRVQDFVSAYSPAARGLVLFFDTVDGFFWHQELDCLLVNHVRWDRDLLLQPLINALDELEDYGVVLVDRVKSRLLVASLGKIEELPGRTAANKRVRHVKKTGSDRAESSSRFQRKADNQIRANLRDVATDIQAFVKARKLRRLVLAGTPETTSELRSLLPARLALCVMGTIDIAMNARAAAVLKQTQPVADAFERETEAEKVSHVITAAAKNGKAVVGLGSTLKEVNADRVWELVYAINETSPGYECPKCAALFAARANRCTKCNSRVQRVGNVIERAVEHAIRNHAKVEVVTGQACAALKIAGGIGALLKTAPSHP